MNIYTTSENLAWQLRQILIDNEIWCTLRQSSQKVGSVTESSIGMIKSNHQSWIINIKASYLHLLYPCKVEIPEQRHLRHVQEDENCFYTPIRQVDRLLHGDRVYNFSVGEDESYIAGGVAVHNCHDDTVIARALAFRAAFSHVEYSKPGIVKYV